MLSSFRKDQGGAAMVLVTVALPLIFGMASFAVDIGYVFYVKSRLQTAADLGALAGGTLLYKADKATVEAQALKYVALNMPKGWSTDKTARIRINPVAKTRC